MIDKLAENGGILILTGVFNPERRVVVGDLLIVRKRNGEVTQKVKNTFGGTLYFVPLISRRAIGWMPTADGGVVPTSSLGSDKAQPPKQQKKWP